MYRVGLRPISQGPSLLILPEEVVGLFVFKKKFYSFLNVIVI